MSNYDHYKRENENLDAAKEALPDLLAALRWAAASYHHPYCTYAKGKSYNCSCAVGAAQDALQKAKTF